MNWIFDRLDGARISDKLEYRGGRVLVLENNALRVVCLPGKGADIVSFFCKSAGGECLSQPFPMMPLRRPDMSGAATLLQTSDYTWPEMFPIASDCDDYFGQGQPLHGEARFLEWRYDIIEDEPDHVAVKLQARMQVTPFVLTRIMRIDRNSPKIIFDEQIENLSSQPLPILWGHHPTFGQPFLDETCRIYLPDGELIDGDEAMLNIDPPRSGGNNMFYRIDISDGRYGIFNHGKEFGFGMRWDRSIFRVIWIYQNYNNDRGAPWFDRRYACAVEPVTSFPQAHPKHKILDPIMVPARQTLSTQLEAFIFDDPKQLGQ